jgi:uncharacterized protein (TIGR02300 family)
VAKSDLGTKRICPTTGKKFYDLNKNPVISPYTGEVVPIAPVAPPPPRWRGGAARATPVPTAEAAPEPMEAEELVSLEEADVEEDTGKVKAFVPESEDDIDGETIEDDREDEDSTIIAGEEVYQRVQGFGTRRYRAEDGKLRRVSFPPDSDFARSVPRKMLDVDGVPVLHVVNRCRRRTRERINSEFGASEKILPVTRCSSSWDT